MHAGQLVLVLGVAASLLLSACRCADSPSIAAGSLTGRAAGGSTSKGEFGGSCVQEILLGVDSSCFLVSAGYYLCRGDYSRRVLGHGDWQQLPKEYRGLGTREYMGLPKLFPRMQLGSTAACGVDSQRRLWCWGQAAMRMLVGDAARRGTPVEQTRFGLVDDFSVRQNICARRGDEVLCAGLKLGEVVGVPGLPSGIRFLGAGSFFACAATEREVYCWGQPSWANDQGSPHATTNHPLPWQRAVRIQGPELEIKALAVGWLHGCVLTTHGAVHCFGDTRYGDWGTGVTAHCDWEAPCAEHNFRALHEVTALGAAVKELAASASCVLKHNGEVWCWGQNQDRIVTAKRQTVVQLPDRWGRPGTPYVVEPLPVLVEDIGRDNVHLYMRSGHACVRKQSGAIVCWGSNAHRQIAEDCDGKPWCTPHEVKVPCPPR